MPYKRGKKWVGKIEVGGKVIYCGTNHPTKTAAKDAETAERKRRSGRMLGGRESVSSFAERWMRDYPYGRNRRRRHKNTVAHNAERVSVLITDPDYKDVAIEDFTRPQAMACARKYPGRAKAMAAMFADMYNDGLVPVHHWRQLGLPENHEEPVILTIEEFEHACVMCEHTFSERYGPMFRSMFEFAAWTGIRPGEMFALKRENLRPRENKLDVKLQTYRDGTQDTPKNYKERVVVLPDQAIAALRGLPLRTDGLLFSSKTGRPMTEGIVTKDWAEVRAAIHRPDLKWYEATKHFCGSQLALAGVPPMEIGHQLGHTDKGETARKHYIHLYPSETHDRVLAGFRSRQGRNVKPLRRAEDGAKGA